jgi:Mrp family chromosome partitioning ATPase
MSMTPGASRATDADVPTAPVILPLEFARNPAGNRPNHRAGKNGSVPHDARIQRTPFVEEFAFPEIAPEHAESSAAGTPGAIWPTCKSSETLQAGFKLAEAIRQRLPPRRSSVLAFTSPGNGDGKTRVLAVLAPELARQTPRGVLVVDADYRNAGLTSLLELAASRTPGNSPLIYPTDQPGLNVLPMPPGLQSRYLDAAWVEQTRENWPLTLLDMASLEYAETVSLLRHCDGVCLVVRLGHTTRRAVIEANRIISASSSRFLGSIVVAKAV